MVHNHGRVILFPEVTAFTATFEHLICTIVKLSAFGTFPNVYTSAVNVLVPLLYISATNFVTSFVPHVAPKI